MTSESADGNFDRKPPVSVGKYDSSIRLFCGAYDEIFKLSNCCLSAVLSPNASILIVGAGTGMEILEFASMHPGWSFCGVDPSGDMLSLAQKKITDKKLLNNMSLIKGYVDDLNTKEVFDGATCILVMHFLKDDGTKLNLLKSIHRHLKPGAPLVLVDGCGNPGSMEFEDTLKAWQQYPIMHGQEIETVEKAFNQTILKLLQFVPEPRILELLTQAGFTRVYKFYSGFLYSGWTAYRG